ncbi:hypothetical protein RA989_20445, partial [Mycobacteroides abscessus subsp. massiliense]
MIEYIRSMLATVLISSCHEANSSQLVGADPIMGAAESITCEILVGRLRDSGTRGDGHDVNCLTRADTLRASA